MARGELTPDAQARVAAAVAAAEAHTGLEICLVVCRPRPESTRTQAERAFRRLGLTNRPAVLVMVLPRARKVEVLTSTDARARLSDEDCAVAVDAMVESFGAGDLAGGIEAGLAVVAYRAGGSADAADQTELPDVVEA